MQPPSVTSIRPVVKLEASEARYSAVPLISLASATRDIGVKAVTAATKSGSSYLPSANRVRKKPGQIALI